MIQCFASRVFESSFEQNKPPRHDFCESRLTPRIRFTRACFINTIDFLELLYVRSGTGIYIVDEQRYNISEGDIIICNAGVLHDEDPSQAH